MKRKDRPRTAKRTELLRVRVSPEEHRTIRARANECGKPTSTFVREVALGTVPRARPGRIDEKAIYHLGRLGNNLNQIARVANTSGRVSVGRRLEKVLRGVQATLERIQ